MRRRNWLQLFRKLVDATDLDFTLNSIIEYLANTNAAFFGMGVVVTNQYPAPFPITTSGMALTGLVGNGIAFDPSGLMVRIDPASTGTKSFTVPAASTTLSRWDLLVIRYKATGDTLVPAPSDPLTTINLNIHDDFELAVIPGTPSASPAYPAKGQYDVILAGLRVPANAVVASSIVVDLGVRDIASSQQTANPVFKYEAPTGAINGSNQAFVLSAVPAQAASLMVFVDGIMVAPAAYTLAGQTVTLTDAPVVGQDIFVRYMALSPASQSPLSQVIETPVGTVNGSNPNFILTGKPGARTSLLVFIDGLLVPPVGYTLLEALDVYTVQFNMGFIPTAGQSVEVSYLINATQLGTTGTGQPGATLATEYPTLSTGDITAGFINLAYGPVKPNAVTLDVIGSGAKIYGTDFTISGTQLIWSSAVGATLSAGNRLRVHYAY